MTGRKHKRHPKNRQYQLQEFGGLWRTQTILKAMAHGNPNGLKAGWKMCFSNHYTLYSKEAHQ